MGILRRRGDNERSNQQSEPKLKSTQAEARLLGAAGEAAQALLVRHGDATEAAAQSLAQRIRSFVYERENRARYVAMATRFLKAKQPALDTTYDVVLIGAGIHAAMFLYTARQHAPQLKALIVEKSADISSTFCGMGDSLVLNSPTFSRIGLNANFAQGHFVQLSDFDELAERHYPTAKHLYELATMVLFHADADILFDSQVEDVACAGPDYQVSCTHRTICARTVVLTNGMGEQRRNAFDVDRRCEDIVDGDDFIAACFHADAFRERVQGARIAVIGAGDTANCVMEHLLPLTYPNDRYPAFRQGPVLPSHIYWIGQSSTNIREYYFANKQRYCHSGGVIECFWDGDAPFDLPAEVWQRVKAAIHLIPDKLKSLAHGESALELVTANERLEVDLAVDCTGRHNALSSRLLQRQHRFIQGDIVLHGGRWDEREDRFVPLPRRLSDQRIACQLEGEAIFLLGCACPVHELIDNDEALDGSLKHQEDKKSLTNSKSSLEHTLPRSVAFAERFAADLNRIPRDRERPSRQSPLSGNTWTNH